MLTFEKSTGSHLHPIGLSKAIDKIIGSVVLAKCLGQGRVLIIVKDIGQKNKLLVTVHEFSPSLCVWLCWRRGY